MMRLLARLRRNRKGATLVEFAFVAPVLLVVMMGLLDMTYRLYATSILQGAVQKAARDATLETGITASANGTIDGKVKDVVRTINPGLPDSAFTFTRRNFTNFTNAGKKEASTGPGGLCATGFTYVDVNNSGTWDDGAIAGQGGADDVVLYTVTVNYKTLFPVNSLFGAPATTTMRASTVLRNQPFNTQAARATGPTRNCP